MLLFFLGMIEKEEDKIKFKSIYEKYSRLMLYIAKNILNFDTMLAEDAVNNAFIRIIKNLDRIDDVDDIRTKAFISVIVKNTAFDIAKKREKAKEEFIDDVEFSTELTYDLTDELSLQETKDLIMNFLETLSPTLRDPLYLSIVHDMPDVKIAKILGVSYNTCRTRLSRGRKLIREKFNRGV